MRNYSRIPIWGLVHKFNVVRKADSDDGYGGILAGGTSTVVYTNVKGRVTRLDGEDEQKMFGNFSGKKWKFILEYSRNIARSDFISLSGDSITAPIDVDDEYRVLLVKHQIDDKGKFHHTSVIAEEE